MPADRLALILAIGDVEGAVDQDGEAQAAAGAEFEHPQAALEPVAQRHQPHAGELRQHAGALGDLSAAQCPAVELDHQLALASFFKVVTSTPMIRLSTVSRSMSATVRSATISPRRMTITRSAT